MAASAPSNIPLYQVDAFASKPFCGNPAAVCPLQAWLPDDVLQAIAEENNLSETVFFVPSQGGFQIRWFTPVCEVDLCGHATLAAAFIIFTELGAPGQELLFGSRSGPLTVTRQDDLLTLDFPSLVPQPCELPKALLEAIGIEPQAVYSAQDYLLVLGNEEQVRAVKPDMAKLNAIDLRGVIITAAGKEVDFVSRFFAPKYGIDEDPVTGSAHCMLTPYWSARLDKKVLLARQLSRRGGEIKCRHCGDRTQLSGQAVLYMQGTLYI